MNTSSKLLLRLECMSCDQCNGSPKELQTATRLCVDQTPTSQANQSKKKKALFSDDSLEWSVSRPSSTLAPILLYICVGTPITTITAQMRAKTAPQLKATTPCQCMQGFNLGVSKTRVYGPSRYMSLCTQWGLHKNRTGDVIHHMWTTFKLVSNSFLYSS